MQKSFSLTHVRYDEGDLLGLGLAIASLVPIAAIVSLSTIVAVRRDVRTISLLGGLCVNEVLNEVLKRVFKEPRPVGTDRDDHGMPSSHAQFILFLSVYLCVALVLVFEIGKKPLGRLLVLGSLAMAAIVSWSRIYLGYHTLPQVAVGAATGAAMALFWFFLVERVALGMVWPVVKSMWIVRVFEIRDYFNVGDVTTFEYTNAIRASTKRTQ